MFNPHGYCRRFSFRVSFAHASSIPVPLGSAGITPLLRYYGHSVLWSGAVLRPLGPERRLLVPTTDPCLPSLNLPAVPSPTTRCRPRLFGLVSQPRLTARVASYPSPGPGRLGLRLSLAGSPRQLAESSSLAYGPAVRLRLLSTSPRGDAVTFDYRGQVQPRAGTFTPLVQCAHRRTRALSPKGPSPT